MPPMMRGGSLGNPRPLRPGETINLGTGGGNQRVPEYPQSNTPAETPAAPATPLPVDPGAGGLLPPPAMPAPAPMPSLQGLQGLGMGGPAPEAAGNDMLSALSITDQGIGQRFPPSLAALLGRKAY